VGSNPASRAKFKKPPSQGVAFFILGSLVGLYPINGGRRVFITLGYIPTALHQTLRRWNEFVGANTFQKSQLKIILKVPGITRHSRECCRLSSGAQ